MAMYFYYKERRFEVKVDKTDFFGRFRGLMFRPRETNNLIFDFKRNTRQAIHSFFVLFPFLTLWLDEKNKVIDWMIVRPWAFSVLPIAKKKFRKIVELPLNGSNERIFRFFVGIKKDLNIT